ncbi:MAG: dockerin type I repeat-containing protein [Prevotellaceae bacterium]|nr:dockerin type I repeat-containing protein [Prevotellaceae bacterium]
MKRSLLFMMFAFVAMLSANALVQPGDYVFTSNARYKIMGGNMLLNGTFDGYDNWKANNPDSAAIDQVYSIETDAAVEGHTMKVNENMGGNFNFGMYQSVLTEPYQSYIITFKIRNVNGAFTSNVNAGATYYNVITAYGKVADIELPAPYDSTGIYSNAYNVGVTTEWQEIAFVYADTTTEATQVPQRLFVQFGGLAVGTEIAEVCICPALEVYDTRKAEKVISYAEMLLSQDCFAEAELREDLQEELDVTKDMIGTEESDYMGDQVESLQTIIDMFLEENTEDYYAIYYGAATEKNNDSPNWNQWTTSYNRAGLTSYGGWTFVGGNWGNRADYDGDGQPDGVTGRPVWCGSLGYGQVYPDESEAYRTFSLPEGTYMRQIQSRGGHMSGYGSQGLSFVINPNDKCMYLQMYVGKDSTEVINLPTTEYETITQFFNIDQTKDVKMGYKIMLDPAYSEQTTGGNVDLYYPVLLRVKAPGQRTITDIKLIADTKSALKDLNSQLQTASKYLNSTDYPWRKDSLQMGYDIYKPMYDEWVVLSDDEIIALGQEKIDEGTDLPTYIYNNATRMMREYYNKPFETDNAPVIALKPQIEDAKATIADPANAKGDKATYQAAIDAAQAVYDHCFTIPQKTVEDSLACREQIEALIYAKMIFKMSIADKDNPAEIPISNGNFAIHSGSKGSFAADGWDIITEDSNGGWQSGFWSGHSSDEPNAEDYLCITFNRGYTAAPLNKATQTVQLTQPGYYTMVFNAYAFNCVESYDNKSNVFYKTEIWDPDFEEWATIVTDSVIDHLGASAFFGLSGTPDTMHVHKNPLAENLGGISLYCDGKSGTYMYGCPPDYYQMTIKKETSAEETYEFGISFMDNYCYCNGGFGNVVIYFTGKDEPYNPVMKPKSDVVIGDADEDGVVTVSDITTIASFILGNNPSPFNKANADVDGDGEITVSDITGTAGIILGK